MRVVNDHLLSLGKPHGNTQLQDRSIVGLLLCAAFEPAVRSLRSLDDLSLQPRVRELIGIGAGIAGIGGVGGVNGVNRRAARATLSDRLGCFQPEALRPIIQHLIAQQPLLKRFDPDCQQVARKIIAADGSWWNLAGEVVTALQMNLGNTGQRKQSRVRLNLQLDVDHFTPIDCDVSGAGDGSEAAAFARRIHPDAIYLVDRNFVHFGFINAVLERGANLVLRLRKDTRFAAESSRPLSPRDRECQIRSDQIGTLCGPTSKGNQGRGSSRTGKPPTRTLRRIVLWDQANRVELILLTDLLDLPAYVIGTLYRLRWQIELFLRWLKVFADFDHLISQSPSGITTQFYVAVIATLLMHMASGNTRVSKHTLRLLAWAAQGRLPAELMAQAMARHERERMLERARRAKKKSS